MSNENITLNVTPRLNPRKGDNRQLRVNKQIPAVVYGSKVENMNLVMDEFFAKKYSARAYENAIFKFQSDDKKLNGISVLMKDIDIHPLTRRPRHVDFYAIDLTATVKVNVELVYEGTPTGVKDEGGLLQTNLRSVEVECLPNDIPSSITADISNLTLGESLHISDLKFPNGVKATSVNDLSLVGVVAQKQEKEEEPAEEAAPTTETPAADTEKK